MLSMPPATMMSFVPAVRRSFANMAAFMPEPHILLTVVQPADSGNPAPRDAWRAGACPWPAGSTQPMMTSCTCSGFMPARSSAARMAAAPSCGAVKSLSSPCIAPIGVRATETITIGSVAMTSVSSLRNGARRETAPEAQCLGIGKHIFDMARFDAALRGGPEIGIEQFTMMFEKRRAYPRIAQQESGEFLGEDVVRPDRIPGLGSHLVLRGARWWHAAKVAVRHVGDFVVIVEHDAAE